jgi:hypothetical protein
MLEDIDWPMDARWIVVNAKEACRVSVKAARDGMEASELPDWWAGVGDWRGASIIIIVRPSVPYDY